MCGHLQACSGSSLGPSSLSSSSESSPWRLSPASALSSAVARCLTEGTEHGGTQIHNATWHMYSVTLHSVLIVHVLMRDEKEGRKPQARSTCPHVHMYQCQSG